LNLVAVSSEDFANILKSEKDNSIFTYLKQLEKHQDSSDIHGVDFSNYPDFIKKIRAVAERNARSICEGHPCTGHSRCDDFFQEEHSRVAFDAKAVKINLPSGRYFKVPNIRFSKISCVKKNSHTTATTPCPDGEKEADEKVASLSKITASLHDPKINTPEIKRRISGLPSIEPRMIRDYFTHTLRDVDVEGYKGSLAIEHDYRKMREYGLTHHLIFEDVPADSLPPGFYNYVVLEDGHIYYGKIEDRWEIGSKHATLALDHPVKIAGQMKIVPGEPIQFDFDSGTFKLYFTRLPFDKREEQAKLAHEIFSTLAVTTPQDAQPLFEVIHSKNPTLLKALEYCRELLARISVSRSAPNKKACTQIESLASKSAH
jgi:hypothetical protein